MTALISGNGKLKPICIYDPTDINCVASAAIVKESVGGELDLIESSEVNKLFTSNYFNGKLVYLVGKGYGEFTIKALQRLVGRLVILESVFSNDNSIGSLFKPTVIDLGCTNTWKLLKDGAIPPIMVQLIDEHNTGRRNPALSKRVKEYINNGEITVDRLHSIIFEQSVLETLKLEDDNK